MVLWYTATEVFGPLNGDGWKKYIDWSRLNHLTELISLDSMLCASIIDVDDNDQRKWEMVLIDEQAITDFYKDMGFVLEHINDQRSFNLLACTINPDSPMENIELSGFEFVGYDLLDCSYSTSALSNCGGFDETFSPTDLNQFGLISRYERAKKVQVDLPKNNPEEYHADCNLWAIWRHKKIGRNVA